MRHAIVLFALAVIVLFSGCGPKKASVSGVITFEGKPLPEHIVSFEPVDVKNSLDLIATGTTDAQGHYTLVDLKTKAAVCPVGKCRVRIIWRNPNQPKPGSEEVAAYNPPVKLPVSTSDGSMTFEVPAGGTDKADFAL